jgi:putative ABC transport system permease protein
LIEDFLNALKNFKINRTRTFLSLLGIIIAVASVIMVTTIGASATGNITQLLGSAGMDMVSVRGGWPKAGTRPLELNEAFRDLAASSVRDIKNTLLVNEMQSSIQRGALDLDLLVQAVEPGYFPIMGFTLDYGRFFSASEEAWGIQKVILGSETVRYLFPEGRAVGKTLTLQLGKYPMSFEVVGVLRHYTENGFGSPNRDAFIPRTVYTRKVRPGKGPVDAILIQGVDKNAAPRIEADIKQLALEKSGGNEYAVMVFSIQALVDQYNQVTRSLNLLLSGIAGISLLVGGIGVMNIMIVTVTERKREIGIRKALGAGPGAIRLQFLVESATLTLSGGILGIILGSGLSVLVVSAFGWALSFEWAHCLLAFVFSAAVGIFFGLNPAIKAARLDPVEALAGE